MTTLSHGTSLALCRLARKDVVLDIQPYTQGIKHQTYQTYHNLQSSGWNRLFPGFERILRIEVYMVIHLKSQLVQNVSFYEISHSTKVCLMQFWSKQTLQIISVQKGKALSLLNLIQKDSIILDPFTFFKQMSYWQHFSQSTIVCLIQGTKLSNLKVQEGQHWFGVNVARTSKKLVGVWQD